MAVTAKTAAYGLRSAVGVLPTVEGVPDHLDGGVTWAGVRVDRAISSHFAGTDAVVEYNTTGSDPNANSAPIVIAPVNAAGERLLGTDDGDTFRMLQTEPVELTLALQHDGTTWTDEFAHDLMSAGMQTIVPASASVTGTGYVAATGVLTCSDASDVVLGMQIHCTIVGTIYVAIVTDIDSDDITLHPRPPAHTAADADYRLCVTYGPQSGATASTKLMHFDYVVDGLAHTSLYNTGVGYRFSLSDSGALQMTALMRPRGGVVFRHRNSEATTAGTVTVLRTPAVNTTQSCFHVSDVLASPQVAPVAESYSDFDATGWTWEVTNEFDAGPACGGIFPEADPSIVKSSVSFTGDSRNTTIFNTMMRDAEFRTIALGFGPLKKGAGLVIPAAFLAATEEIKSENDNVRLTGFEFSNETWTGADGAVAGSVAAGGWSIGIPLSST